jgi:insulysin
MRLIVNSTLPLDELVKIVVEDFKEIPNHHLSEQQIDEEMILNDVKGHMIYIEPITHMRRLSLVWNLPGKFSAMRATKPELIACYILNNQGKGSLLNELKRERLAEDIHCSGNRMGSNFEFAIEIELTDAGVKDVNKVILKCFQAIAKFKEKGIPQHLFDELHQMTTLSYQFQEREHPFETILKEAESIAEEDMSTYPERTYLIEKFDPKAVNDLLSYLTPDTCIYSLIAPTTLTKVALDRKERWLNVAYTIKAIPTETLRAWNSISTSSYFNLPGANPFLPEKMNLSVQKNVKSPSQQIPHPELLFDN